MSKMIEATVSIPSELVIESRGVEETLDLTKLNADLLAKLIVHGATQKVADAASQAAGVAVKEKHGDKAKPSEHREWLKTKEAQERVLLHTATLMDKAARGLEANEWSQRGTGGAVDEDTHVARIVMKRALRAKLGGESEEWKAFVALAKSEADSKLDELWSKNGAKLADAHKAELDKRAKEREDAKRLKAIDIEL